MINLLILKHHLLTTTDNLDKDCEYHIGMNFWIEIRNVFLNKSFEVITYQDFITNSVKFKNFHKYIICNEPDLLNIFICKLHNINMYVALCGESPINAFSYHIRLNFIGFFYNKIWGFSGVKKLLIFNKKKLINLNWPVSEKPSITYISFSDRKLLAFIASAKSKFPFSSRPKFKSISKFIRKPRYYFNSIKSFIFSNLLGHDLSTSRFDYIKTLSKKDGFFLFGRGWENALIDDPFYKNIIVNNKPIEVVNKIVTLSEFKFCLCFENTDYPGYHTEKILDAFKSGCIPVYLGSDTITGLIPSECFINVKKFRNPIELYEYLSNMNEDVWLTYYYAIDKFLSSKEFKETFVDKSIANKFYTFLQNDL